MVQMTTKYLGSLRTKATHLKSGDQLLTDAPVDNNGKGEAFSPTDLVCTALASCMTTLMGIYANKHNIDLTGLQTNIVKVMSKNPRKINEIIIDFKLNDFHESEKHITRLKNAAMTCPVALSLSADLKQTVTFNF